MNTRVLSFLVFAVSLASCVGIAEKTQKTEIEGYEVAKEGAWCWFADPRAIHHENASGTINKTYIGYIDIHGNVKASQYDFKTGEANEVLIRSCFQPDDHDNPTFLLLPDDRVVIFYSRHTDEPCFYYRVSNKPGDITDLSPEFTISTRQNTTYPSPFILSDDPDHFYICWRGISWHPTIARFSLPDAAGKVELDWGPNQIVQSTAARPYAKYASNGKDKIYLAYTTGHPDPTMPNYLYLNYIDINTRELKDVTGKVMSKIGEEIHQLAATPEYKDKYPQAVVDDSQLRNWLWQTVIDPAGNPVIAMVTINEDKSSHDYYYVRWTGSNWQKTFLSNAGGHFHQSPDIEKCYSAGMAIDDQKPNELYCSVPVEGQHGRVYELVKYTVSEQGEISQTDTLTRDSKKNNVRPFIIPNRKQSPVKLTWMNGDYYDWIVSKERPLGFNTSIYADYNFKNEAVKLDSALVKTRMTVESDGENKRFYLPEKEEFSVFLDLKLDTVKNGGQLFIADNFSLTIDPETFTPFFTIGDKEFRSINVLGNSDNWQHEPRSTNSLWYAAQKYSSIQLTLVFRKGELISYINGLVDQVVPFGSRQPGEFQLGEMVQQLEACKIYNRPLNYTEITALSAKEKE